MASSRLKRKLHNHPDAPSHYGNVDESFVEIGTALPSLTSTKRDTNEFKPLWEQEVFDDQGRKRLHGAFTGGFSAGYYNTVGSKEGWTPSTFKSSRAKRNDSQRKSSSTGSSLVDAAKHFMDDEDLEELANSRQLETSSSYAAPSPSSSTYDPLLGLFGNSNPSSNSTSNSSSTIPTAQATLASLLEPSPSRIGLKLMRKMSWRPGQGCGPRLTKTQRKRQALELGLVLQLSFEEEEEEEEEGGDEERFGHYYAPLDRPLILLDAVAASQDKGRGLGYDSWSGVGGARRKEVREQRLGAGAGAGGKRNEKGSMREEEDPYAQDEGQVVQELMDEEDDDGQMERMQRQRVDAHSSDRPKGKHKDETFHDGVKVLSGFVLHHEPYKPPTTSQLPPNPPEEWRPNPTKVWAEEQAEAMRSTSAQQEGKENRAHAQLNADQRGTLLGEKLPPPPLKSVFEYLSSKDKERLSTLSTTGHLPPSKMPTSGTSSNLTPLGANRSRPSPSIPSRVAEPDEEFIIPALDSSTASLALRGFQPFSSASTSPDPIRQARYTLFLQYSAGQLPTSIQGFPFGPRPLPLSTTHNSSSTSSNNTRMQTMKELNKELRDYVASAKVFKPVSGMLGNRFTSGTSASALLVPQAEPGLYTPVLKTKEDHELIEEEEKKKKGLGVRVELTPVEEAIKNDQFGPLTRITTTFRPDKLLCKRFGVADPFGVKKGEDEDEGGQSVGGKWKEANLEGEFKVPLDRGGAGRKVEDVLGMASMDELMREANGGIMPAHTPGTTDDPGEGLVDHIALATSTRLNPKAPLPTLETVGLGDDERQGEETLTYEKAPRDIFETIFGESDDEQSEDEDEDGGFPLEARGEVGSNAGKQPMQVEVPLEVEVPRPTLGPTMAPSGPTLGETTTLLSSETVVDYKPTFVKRSSNKSAGSEKDKKKKKEKEKRKAGTLSFDMGDEEEGAGGANVGKAVKKVKKERDTKREGKKVETQTAKKPVDAVDEADEWEEAPSIVHPSILASSSSSSGRKPEEEKNESAIGAGAKISFEPVKRARAADLF